MENRKHTSLKDLAQALGVSIPTVSRALKDSPEISRELCAKAKALAKEMNYRPNPFAMSLRKKCATYHWSGSPGYCHSFLCINSEWNREYGYCQRVFRDYHDLA